LKFDNEYYEANSQDKDRPALAFYSRIWARYISEGPTLEFGCGVGHLAKRLSKKTKVFGYEINEFARKQIVINAPDVKLIESLSDMDEGSVGSIVALHVLEHIDDHSLEDIGASFKRILKPGGKLLFVMPNAAGLAHRLKGGQWSAFSDPTHINLKSSHEWSDFFETRWRMKVLDKFSDGFYDFPYEKSWGRIFLFDLFRLGLTALQFILGTAILKEHYGENTVYILEKNK